MPRPKGAYASRNQTFKRCKYNSFKDGDRIRCLRNPKHNTRVNSERARRYNATRNRNRGTAAASVVAQRGRRTRQAAPAPPGGRERYNLRMRQMRNL